MHSLLAQMAPTLNGIKWSMESSPCGIKQKVILYYLNDLYHLGQLGLIKKFIGET